MRIMERPTANPIPDGFTRITFVWEPAARVPGIEGNEACQHCQHGTTNQAPKVTMIAPNRVANHQ